MWALVTGGARRLGAALCLGLAERGYSVVVHYRQSRQEAEEVVLACRSRGVKAAAVQGDFSSILGVELFLERYLDVFADTELLVNNAADYLIASALHTSAREWMDLFQLNLHVPFMLMKALTPQLTLCRGQIINLGVSGLHRQVAHTYSTAYTLTKQALWGLTLAYARELAPMGVRVNMVSPGQLDISTDSRPVPMGRTATCQEVSRVVNFLLDPQSAYLTGQNIEVAGGLSLA